jgi:hypothetical protein
MNTIVERWYRQQELAESTGIVSPAELHYFAFFHERVVSPLERWMKDASESSNANESHD